MQGAEALSTIAEVGLGLAGFTGIPVVLGVRGATCWRLSSALLAAFTAVARILFVRPTGE